MSRLLALEWDAREARLVVARTTGKSVEVEQAFTVPLDGRRGDGGRKPRPAEAGSSELGSQAGRPPAASGTWDAVRRWSPCRAARSSCGCCKCRRRRTRNCPNWSAFRPCGSSRRWARTGRWISSGCSRPIPQQVRVLAATVAPAGRGRGPTGLRGVGIAATSLVLRPFAAASFFSRYVAADRCRLMVELFAEEADLNVVAGGQVLLLRSVRLPTHDRDAALVGEIRRHAGRRAEPVERPARGGR